MSDIPQGHDWWQASDDKWYAPELHPDYQAPDPSLPPEQPVAPRAPEQQPPSATPGISDFEPPRIDQRVGIPDSGAPQVIPPVGQPPQRYPTVPTKKRSTGKILAIVFGLVFLLIAGGCGVVFYAFRDEIADAAVDFSNGVAVTDEASCDVLGVDFGTTYEIDATVFATDSTVDSHYQLSFEVRSSDGDLLGEDVTVFRDMAPEERRTKGVFHSISADEPYETTTCEVVGLLRVSA